MLYLKVAREENCKCLSHANKPNEPELWLQDGYQGEGELFVVKYGLNPQGPIVLECIGKELGKYLSHDNHPRCNESDVWLQGGYKGEGEEWILHHHKEGAITFECNGKKKGMYLSHASGIVQLKHGYPGENELWYPQDVDYLTDQQFTAQTGAWQSLARALPQEFSFFYINELVGTDKVLAGAKWKSDIVEFLLSRTSVTTIKVRFGLDRGGINPPRFNLILFGTDDFGEVLTPYFLARAMEYVESPVKIPSSGNVPTVLVNKWLKYWSEIGQKNHAGPSIVSYDLFTTHYGFLNGYNYPVKEFYSLLSSVETEQVPDIMIQFALHKFSPIAEDGKVNQEYTFGLLFFQTKDTNSSKKSYDENKTINLITDSRDESPYFDLSTPCPRTC